jgi:RHS repeat-associated protein
MNGENDTMYYVHKDYLGSYDVITDEQGHIMERYSFDPWGRRRNPADWTYTSVPAPHLFDRGYTGHEHLDKFGLINMNGRVYDPWLSRFLSPDPFVQTTTHSQSYNRYSYCLNNPLKYTDPSGYKQKPFFEWEANATYYYGGSGFSGRIGPGSGSYWSDHFGNSVSGIGSYSYDWETGNYYNNLGRQVSFNEVYRNYIQPNQVNSTSADQILVTIEFERYTPKLTKRYTPGLSEWTMDDGSIWYAYGYDIITTKKVFEVASGGGGGNDLLEAVGASAYWAGTINTLYGINEEKNLAENLSRAKGYKQVTGRVPKSLRTSVNYGKATTALTKGVSRSLFGVGIVLSSVDVYQDPSVSNIAWNSADVLMGAAAFIPGMQIPALIYFTARTAYEVYDAYKEP